MIFSGPLILETILRTKAALTRGLVPDLPAIDVNPFEESHLGPNSLDVCLDDSMLIYPTTQISKNGDARWWLDPNEENLTREHPLQSDGVWFLEPGRLYLASTRERTVTCGVVPYLDGRSSIGRLGIQIHMTAGRGDDGFGESLWACGGCAWTMEISVLHKVVLRPGDRIGQLTFMEMKGSRKPYKGRYSYQEGPTPSRFWKDSDA